MRARILRFELLLNSYWQKIDFSRNCPKFYIFIKSLGIELNSASIYSSYHVITCIVVICKMRCNKIQIVIGLFILFRNLFGMPNEMKNKTLYFVKRPHSAESFYSLLYTYKDYNHNTIIRND